MIILSHRGYWKKKNEKNSITAFERSFFRGFGTETDIRDFKGELVVSHDIANENCVSLRKFFEIYKNCNKNLPLALNIKADGLQSKLKELIKRYKIENYFVFDMSIPDKILYLKHDLVTFTRQSEYEIAPICYDKASGVWMDEFREHWIDKTALQRHLANGKKVCIVSPELHRREYKKEWQDYKQIEKEIKHNDIMICTDYPEEAREFFGGYN